MGREVVRAFAALLAAILALVGCAAGAEMRTATDTALFADGPYLFTANQTTLYTLQGTTLRRYDAQTLEPLSEAEVIPGIAGMAVGEDGLYVSTASGIALLNESGDIAREWKLGFETSQFFATDKYIVALERTAETATGMRGSNVWLLDRETGEIAQPQDAADVFAMCAAQEKGQALLVQPLGYGYALSSWNPETGEIAPLAEFSISPEVMLADGTDGLYFLRQDSLYRMDITTGLEELICRMDAPCTGLALAGDRLFTQDGQSGFLIAAERIAEEARTLCLVNLTARKSMFESAAALFESTHPGVSVQFVTMTDEQLSAALLSQEEHIDILPISSYNLRTYEENGVLADLSQSALIMKSLADWRDFGGRLSAGEPLYALPYFLDAVDILSAETGVLEQCGVDTRNWKPGEMNWSEFYAFCARLQREHGVTAYVESDRFPEPVMQYIASFNGDMRAMTFQKKEFSEILRVLKDCHDEGVVPFGGEESGVIDVSYIPGALDTRSGTYGQYPLPKIGDEPVYPALWSMLGVNARSENAELAMEFLAVFASAELQGRMPNLLAALLKDKSLYDMAVFEAWGNPITDESFAMWDEVSEHLGDRGLPVEFSIYLGDSMEAYLRGEMDENALARSLDEMVRMVLFG